MQALRRSSLFTRCKLMPWKWVSQRHRAVARHSSTALQPLVVVLDMDECLVHSTDFSSSDEGLRQHENARPHSASLAGMQSFRCRATSSLQFTVLKRQGVDNFLDACLGAFETYVFTAGTETYASPILDKLDPGGRLAGRLYRHDCSPVRTAHGEQYLKDLSAVARRRGQPGEDLARMVLVDNNPLSFICQPQNGILVPDFVGEPDNVLSQVLELLKRLNAEAADVRPVLSSIFGLETMLTDVRREILGPQSKL